MFSKSIESDFSILNWIAESEKTRYVCSREILLNTATINSTEIDSKFYGEGNTGLHAIIQRQATNNQTSFQNFKTRNWIHLQWLSLAF